jgi:ABC-2 type transport system ATP-binding protein
MDPVIEVDRLHKRYGPAVAVDEVSFQVNAGEIFGILGPNGAGKTSTVECVQGLRERDGGRVSVLGLDPGRDGRQLRRRIGAQLQESALPDRLRVWEALDLFSSLAPGGTDWRLLLEQWGLAGKAKASFASLSGGQRQRLFVALALVSNPEVVFLARRHRPVQYLPSGPGMAARPCQPRPLVWRWPSSSAR